MTEYTVRDVCIYIRICLTMVELIACSKFTLAVRFNHGQKVIITVKSDLFTAVRDKIKRSKKSDLGAIVGTGINQVKSAYLGIFRNITLSLLTTYIKCCRLFYLGMFKDLRRYKVRIFWRQLLIGWKTSSSTIDERGDYLNRLRKNWIWERRSQATWRREKSRIIRDIVNMNIVILWL